jgi:hypothetical protein
LLNLIDHLPRDSHYIAAIANDDEVMAELPADAKPSPPPLTEWSAEVAALAVLVDRLGELIRLMAVQVSGKKQRPIPPYPRPITAADKVRRRRKHHKHQALRARLLPGR